jgi:hypothetical protein
LYLKGKRNSDEIVKKKVADTETDEDINGDFYIDGHNKKWQFLQDISSKAVQKAFPSENNLVVDRLATNGNIRLLCLRYRQFDVERCPYNGTF